ASPLRRAQARRGSLRRASIGRRGRRAHEHAPAPPAGVRRRRLGQADLLADVLALARQEGALEGERLEVFVSALRERAALILDERLGALKTETAWRREAMAGLEQRAQSLEKENAWRRDAMT